MSGGLGNFTSLNAPGAHFHSFGSALRLLDSNRLKIWIESPGRTVICVGNIIAELRPFTANFTTFGHDFLQPPSFTGFLMSSYGIIRTAILPQSESGFIANVFLERQVGLGWADLYWRQRRGRPRRRRRRSRGSVSRERAAAAERREDADPRTAH